MDLNKFLNMPFLSGLENFLSRRPVVAATPEELRNKYTNQNVFGAVFAMVETITRNVKQVMAQGFADGLPASKIEEHVIGQAPNFTRNYAEVVVRTNMNTAYTEGRKEQAKAMGDLVAGFEFASVGDADTRNSHDVLDRMRARTDDPIWDMLKPPIDYNCRCTLITVTRPDVRPEWLDQRGRLRRWHPLLGYDFRDTAILGIVRREDRKGKLPNFVQSRI